MENKATTINCPNCRTAINVSEILYLQVQGELKKDYERQLALKEESFKAKQAEIDRATAHIKREQEIMPLLIENSVKNLMVVEKEKLEVSIKARLNDENAEQMQTMQKELDEKSLKVRELNQTKAEIERLKREKEELRDTIVLEKEKELTERLRTEKLKIQTQVEEQSAMKIEELKKQLDDQKKQAEEMIRKAEQKSMQLQGEVQELAIEDWLRIQFPLDTIDEVKKGQNGADCVQIVHTHNRLNCGKICYESKRTKNFSGDWIAKLKEDTLRAGANIGVLVTTVYPKDMIRMGLLEGVWICSFEEFKGLCTVLRQGIIEVNTAMATQENKGDKMVMLYHFLTGNEFRTQVEAIVDGFTQMKTSLNKEKMVALKNFSEREKQIEKVTLNTISMYGSIKGIAGNAIQEIKMLEMGEVEE